MNLPQDFITRMQELLKEEFDSFLSGYQNTKSYGLRVIPLKYNKDPKALPFDSCALGKGGLLCCF